MKTPPVTEWLQLRQGVHIMNLKVCTVKIPLPEAAKDRDQQYHYHKLQRIVTSKPTLTVQPLPHATVTSMIIMNKTFTCKPEWRMAAMRPPFHLLTTAVPSLHFVHTIKVKGYVLVSYVNYTLISLQVVPCPPSPKA